MMQLEAPACCHITTSSWASCVGPLWLQQRWVGLVVEGWAAALNLQPGVLLPEAVVCGGVLKCWLGCSHTCEPPPSSLAPSASAPANPNTMLHVQGDADKVRTNGVRAVGTLLGILTPEVAKQAGLDLPR